MVPQQKILHIITDLGQGGAEAVLFRLIGATEDSFRHEVVSLHQEGVYGAQLSSRGVKVTALGMPRGRVKIRGLSALRKIIAVYRPDVIQTRLDHANLLGGLAARTAGSPPIVWAVHSTDLGPLGNSWKTRVVRRACALLSHALPEWIVTDAHSSAALHERLGFSAGKIVVVPNGVDPSSFRPDLSARAEVRQTWSVSDGDCLIGCVARWDPLKDHQNLLRALRLLRERGYDFRCALVGRGMNVDNRDLMRMIARFRLDDQLILAGARSDVPAVMNALDVHVLSSRSESLPVAVIEAMACGTPCVVTDVGDARHIVGDTGWTARPQDSVALADALQPALCEHRAARLFQRAERCRARISREFSLARMGAEYAALWAKAARGHVGG